MHQKDTSILTVLLLIGLLVAACGGVATSAPAETTGTTVSSSTTTTTNIADSRSEADMADQESDTSADEADESARPDGWGEETHSNSAIPITPLSFLKTKSTPSPSPLPRTTGRPCWMT